MILANKDRAVTVVRMTCLGLLLAAFWVTLRWAPVRADVGSELQCSAPVELSGLSEALADLVARVSFNEALGSYDDLAMIWQTTEGHGVTDAERFVWLERHSGCVSGRLTQDQARLRPDLLVRVVGPGRDLAG